MYFLSLTFFYLLPSTFYLLPRLPPPTSHLPPLPPLPPLRPLPPRTSHHLTPPTSTFDPTFDLRPHLRPSTLRPSTSFFLLPSLPSFCLPSTSFYSYLLYSTSSYLLPFTFCPLHLLPTLYPFGPLPSSHSPSAFCLLLPAFYFLALPLPSAFCLLPAACCLLPAACYLPASCCLLPFICFLFPATCTPHPDVRANIVLVLCLNYLTSMVFVL